jgi:hypothetical protein
MEDTYPRCLDIVLDVTVDRVRRIATAARKSGGGFSSEEAEAFLLLHGEQLRTILASTLKKFIEEKLT